MGDQRSIKILENDIPVSCDDLDIHTLKFLPDNPRVFSCTHGEAGFSELDDNQQQEKIYEKLLKEPSVENLLPEIKRHGGLMEPILVRLDRMEVIEGNSRLAVYRKLHDEAPGTEKEKWQTIPCEIISSLSEEEQYAFLNQVHVKGKTTWSAYEKANFAFVRYDEGKMTIDEIAKIFGESKREIQKRIDVIKGMKRNEDVELSHFSYYDVITRNREISKAVKDDVKLRDVLHKRIKELGKQPSDEAEFTAQELRRKLPPILTKPKIRKRFMGGQENLDDCYQDAKESNVREIVKRVLSRLKAVTKRDLSRLEPTEINALAPEARRLCQEAERVRKIVLTVKGK